MVFFTSFILRQLTETFILQVFPSIKLLFFLNIFYMQIGTIFNTDSLYSFPFFQSNSFTFIHSASSLPESSSHPKWDPSRSALAFQARQQLHLQNSPPVTVFFFKTLLLYLLFYRSPSCFDLSSSRTFLFLAWPKSFSMWVSTSSWIPSLSS